MKLRAVAFFLSGALLVHSAAALADPPVRIYWMSRATQELFMGDANGSTPQLLASTLPVSQHEAVDANDAIGRVYWASSSNDVACHSGLDGSNVTCSSPGLFNYWGIRVDAANGHVYLAGETTVRRTDLELANPLDVVTDGGSMRGLALDLVNGKIYWSLVDSGSRIDRANLDGTNVETVVGIASFATGVAVDPAGGAIYYAQGRDIFTAELDGSNPTMIVDDAAPFAQFVFELEVDHDRGKLYWVQQGGDVDSLIRRSNLDGSNIETIYDRDETNIRGLAILPPVSAHVPAASPPMLAMLALALAIVAAARLSRSR